LLLNPLILNSIKELGINLFLGGGGWRDKMAVDVGRNKRSVLCPAGRDNDVSTGQPAQPFKKRAGRA